MSSAFDSGVNTIGTTHSIEDIDPAARAKKKEVERFSRNKMGFFSLPEPTPCVELLRQIGVEPPIIDHAAAAPTYGVLLQRDLRLAAFGSSGGVPGHHAELRLAELGFEWP